MVVKGKSTLKDDSGKSEEGQRPSSAAAYSDELGGGTPTQALISAAEERINIRKTDAKAIPPPPKLLSEEATLLTVQL